MASTSYEITKLKPSTDGARIVNIKLGANSVVYGGTIGIVGYDGYLYNATSTQRGIKAVVVIDTVDNTGGSAGALSAKVYWGGRFEFAATSLTQAMVGGPLFVTDNVTVDETPATNAVKLGTLVNYISATKGEVLLDESGVSGQTVDIKLALTAAGDGTAGAVLAFANPFGRTMLVQNVVLDITTAPTDTLAALDVGIAANGTTSNDSLIDGVVLGAAGAYSCHNKPGTNGGADRKITSGQYITATSVTGSHLDLAAMVGTATITFKYI